MIGQTSHPLVPYEDYLAGEATSALKRGWLDGVVYAMSRGTPEHARLSANVAALLRARFRGECVVYSSDAVLFVRETQLSSYTNASMTCGAVETYRVVKNGRALGEAITNPRSSLRFFPKPSKATTVARSSDTSCE